jgi:ribosomal 50S subunit-recycling heat shock protein
MEIIRIDKWLWCIRVFKSRTLATDACDGGKVKIDGKSVKPSRHVKPGEIITVQQGYVKRQYRVVSLLEKRVSFCELRIAEKEFFIRKAIGWSLREYAKTDPNAVADFINAHREELSGLSFREGSKHIKHLITE